MPITHAKVSVIPDGANPNQVQASTDWNAEHVGEAGGGAMPPLPFLGDWDNGTTYDAGDAVRGDDSGAFKLYISQEAGNIGNDPTVGDPWTDVDASGIPVIVWGTTDPNDGDGLRACVASIYLWQNSDTPLFYQWSDDAGQWKLTTDGLLSALNALTVDVIALQADVNCEHASEDEEATTTTLFTHPELGVNCDADWQWHFRFLIFLLNDGATEGVKFALLASEAFDTFGMKAQITIHDDALGTSVTGRVTTSGESFGSALSAGNNHAVIEGVADIAGSPNTITLQFGQNATGANAGVHVQVNSSSIFTRIAQSS